MYTRKLVEDVLDGTNPPSQTNPYEALILLELTERNALMTAKELCDTLDVKTKDTDLVKRALSELRNRDLVAEFTRRGSKEVFYRETFSPEHRQGWHYTPPDFQPLF